MLRSQVRKDDVEGLVSILRDVMQDDALWLRASSVSNATATSRRRPLLLPPLRVKFKVGDDWSVLEPYG